MHAYPMSCLRPAPESAATFAALPYDVFDRASAKAYVEKHPKSFLAIDRPETAFGPDQDMYAPEVYAKGKELLDERVEDGTLIADGRKCYYLYRLEQDGRSQTGIVCAAAVDDFVDGTIRRHENTRADKEQDRIDHITALNAQTGPVFLAYRDEPVLNIILSAAMSGRPVYDFTDEEGVHQTVWRVARQDAVDAIQAMLERIPNAYIADGHHRAASAVKVALAHRKAHPDASPKAPWNAILCVLFPASELKILPYNRVVEDALGLTADELLDAVKKAGFDVSEATEKAPELSRHEFALFHEGAWRKLSCTLTAEEETDPVASLDCSLLQDRILGPILHIEDPRRDARIRFIGGIEGTDALERAAGAEGVAFSLFPTSMAELMRVADAGLLMPPKSTWFEPKLRSGLFIRPLDGIDPELAMKQETGEA
ncbi:MAG: DUF1015 domain-containing protein [Atopobiaceae bacterium]